MSFRLVVSADFLESQHAPAICLFTGATAGVEQRPLRILTALPGEVLVRQKSPTEQWATALRNRQLLIEAGGQVPRHWNLREQWRGERLLKVPHTAAGRWHNRLPTLLGIGMIAVLVMGVLIGVALFLEPDPAAQAMKLGLPPPPPNAPPPPPTAISPLSPGAFALYGGVAAALLLLIYLRMQYVTARQADDSAVILTFPNHREAVYAAYRQAYDHYFALPAPGNLEELIPLDGSPLQSAPPEPADGGDPIAKRSDNKIWD